MNAEVTTQTDSQDPESQGAFDDDSQDFDFLDSSDSSSLDQTFSGLESPSNPSGLSPEALERIKTVHAQLATPRCKDCFSFMRACQAPGFWVCTRCNSDADTI